MHNFVYLAQRRSQEFVVLFHRCKKRSNKNLKKLQKGKKNVKNVKKTRQKRLQT